MARTSTKIKDVGIDVSRQSRLDDYWQRRGFYDWYKGLRSPKPGLKGTESIPELYEIIISRYGFSAIEFGNWVNNESRFNYLVAAIIAIQDIQKIINFPATNAGMNKFSLAFGSRGQGSALAHFEPGSWVINLTRHSRGDDFGKSGGIGSLAHEYGHALDYYFGTYKAKNWPLRSVTLGRSIAMYPEELPPPGTMQGIACRMVFSMIWKKEPGGEHTAYYQKLIDKFAGSDYWFRHNELFARAFEQYIDYKLRAKKISNKFLTHGTKYDNAKAYMDQPLLKKIIPQFDKLLGMMRKNAH